MNSDSLDDEFAIQGPDESAEANARLEAMLEREGIGDGNESESESDNVNEQEVVYDNGWHRNLNFNERRLGIFNPRQQTGPTNILSDEKTAVDFFQLFVSDELIQHIINETDRFAQQEKTNNPNRNKMPWFRPYLQEMKAFLGMCFLMGIDKKPDIKMHWSTDPYLQNPFFSKTMTRDRFCQLMRYLHFVNSETVPRVGERGYDVLHKIRYIVDQFNSKMKENYVPHQNVSVDECMIPFKGRVKFRQYIPRKPVKWGIKLWALADSLMKYLCYVDIYSGKSDQPERNLAANVVKRCVDNAGIRGRNYHVYMDSYFTSPDLLSSLFDNYSTQACGTVRKVWRGLPTDFKRKRVENVTNRGDMKFRQKGPLLCVAWKDKKVVTILSTIHNETTTVVSRTTNTNGQFQRVDLQCPQAAADYTHYMGGVDGADQYTQYYAFIHKTLKWYKRVFFKMLEMVKLCAFQCLLASPNHQPAPGKPPITFLKFTQEVIAGLVHGYQQEARAGRPPLAPMDARLVQRHLPGSFPTRSWCHVCWKEVANGNQTVRKQTKFGCTECGKHLCLPHCFTVYHSRRIYYQ